MIGCTSGGRGGGGSRNPAFAPSTTPVSESLEMVKKPSWPDESSDTVIKNEIENNGGILERIDETRVRIHDDQDNGTTPTPIGRLKKSPRSSISTQDGVVPSDSRKYLCGLSNFQITFIMGMIGFILFWMGLLLRIYLPDEFFL